RQSVPWRGPSRRLGSGQAGSKPSRGLRWILSAQLIRSFERFGHFVALHECSGIHAREAGCRQQQERQREGYDEQCRHLSKRGAPVPCPVSAFVRQRPKATLQLRTWLREAVFDSSKRALPLQEPDPPPATSGAGIQMLLHLQACDSIDLVVLEGPQQGVNITALKLQLHSDFPFLRSADAEWQNFLAACAA